MDWSDDARAPLNTKPARSAHGQRRKLKKPRTRRSISLQRAAVLPNAGQVQSFTGPPGDQAYPARGEQQQYRVALAGEWEPATTRLVDP